MKIKYKILLLVFGIFLVLSIVLGSSYAIWVYTAVQEGTNALSSDCFEITFEDSNAISLSSTMPLSEEEGSNLVPYTFTIKNICNHMVGYNVNIETLNASTLNTNYLRYKIDNKKSNILGNIENNDSSLIVNNNVSSSKTIISGMLDENSEKTYKLRFWIDEDSTKEQSANKNYLSKVVVIATLKKVYTEATVMDNENFWNAIDVLFTDGANYSKVLTAQSLPDDSIAKVNVSETPGVPVYVWIDNDVLYFYSDADKVFLNSNCSEMFSWHGSITELDLSMFDTSRVTNMSEMFTRLDRLESLDLSNFDTSNVTNMSGMFKYMTNIKSLDLSNFDTSNVTNMSGMFDGLEELKSLDLSSFNTSKVTNMSWMFNQLYNLESLNLSNFDTSSVTNMSKMFSVYDRECVLKRLDLSNFDTANVTDMSSMFGGINSLEYLDIRGFNTSNVRNMSSMFTGLHSIKQLDISNFDTSNVTDMSGMFNDMINLETIYVSNSWNTSKVTVSWDMFNYCYKLVGGAGTAFNSSNTSGTYARVDNPTNGKPGYLTLKTN